MRIYKVLPDISKTRHMKIWHKALRSQWSAADIDWTKPHRMRSRRLKDQMARLLTPVLMGEQAALYSVSGLIPVLGQRSEFESQLYLTTWAVDEGRHAELFTRFYHRLDREPMSIRRFQSGYLFQSQIVSQEPSTWLAGVLISEVLAKLVMQELTRLDLDPVLSEIADGVLQDEARHLGFNHIYIEDVFSRLAEARAGAGTAPGEAGDGDAPGAPAHTVAARGKELHARLEEVFTGVPPMFAALEEEMREIGIDAPALLDAVHEEASWRLQRSIEAGERVAAGRARVSDPALAAEIGR